MASRVKDLPANAEDAGDMGSIPGWGRSPKWQPSPVFLPRKSRGQRSLAGYIQSMGSQRVRHNRGTEPKHDIYADIFQIILHYRLLSY